MSNANSPRRIRFPLAFCPTKMSPVPLLSEPVASSINVLSFSGVSVTAVNPLSSLRIVPVAVAVLIVAPTGLESVTVKPSSGSTVVSPLTLIVITLEVSVAANVTLPLGSTLPAKSAALAAFVPLPVTA